jgi:hypothetical protein
VADAVAVRGGTLSNPTHNISSDGARYLGEFDLTLPNVIVPEGMKLKGAVVNAHDKSSSTRFLLGNTVFICSNGSYFADYVLARRHTTFINRDLPDYVDRLMRKVTYFADQQTSTIQALNNSGITHEPTVHDFLIKTLDKGIIAASQIPKVLDEWRTPSFHAFTDRNAWSLVNAFTTLFRDISMSPFQLGERTPKLYREALAHFTPTPTLSESEASISTLPDESETTCKEILTS